MGIIAFLIYICLCLMPCASQAASTANATEMIVPSRSCTLTVSYGYNGTAFGELPVKLYQIADVSSDLQYTLTAPFAATGLTLNGIRTNSEWNVIRSTLESHIIANRVTEDRALVTGQNGQVCFENLKPGLYLAVPGLGVSGDVQCAFDAALVALPGLGTDGKWQYQQSVTAKGTPLPPINADEEISYKIVKLWKGDSRYKRPQKIEVEIFRNGESYELVTLSKDNFWSYSWTVKDDGAVWTVAERNVPSGYTATMEKRDMTFILTNTRIPNKPGVSEPPKTGDTSNVMLYMTLMYGSGILLVLLGILGKRRRV